MRPPAILLLYLCGATTDLVVDDVVEMNAQFAARTRTAADSSEDTTIIDRVIIQPFINIVLLLLLLQLVCDLDGLVC